MTLDETVSSDLAALGADSRHRLRSVDDSLRALHAARRSARDTEVAVPPALLPLASAFAARVARAAGGAAALACTLVLLVALHDPAIDHGRPYVWWRWFAIEGNAAAIAAVIAVVVLGKQAVAAAAARRWVEARVRSAAASPGALAELAARLARGGDGWSIGLSIAGTTCAALVIAVVTWTVGPDRWTIFHYDGAEAGPLFAHRLRDLTIAVPAIAAAALVIGRACARGARWPGLFAHRIATPLATAVAAMAVFLVFACDLAPFSWDDRFASAADAPRTVLTVAAALAIFVLTAGQAVRRRAASYRADQLAAVSPDDAALLPVAGVFRARIARSAGGALAALCAIALVVVLHNPSGAIPSPDKLWWNGSSWKLFVFQDHITIVALVIAALLWVRQHAAALADRAFERRFGGAASRDLGAARRLVERLAGPTAVLGVAGITSLVLLVGLLDLTIGDDFWIFFQHHGVRVDSLLRHTLRELVAAITACITTALLLGPAFACRTDRARWRAALGHPATLIVGAALVALAVVAWLCLDFGIDDVSAALADQPSVVLQNLLTAAAAVGLLLVTGGIAAHQRRGEHERAGLPPG